MRNRSFGDGNVFTLDILNAWKFHFQHQMCSLINIFYCYNHVDHPPPTTLALGQSLVSIAKLYAN